MNLEDLRKPEYWKIINDFIAPKTRKEHLHTLDVLEQLSLQMKEEEHYTEVVTAKAYEYRTPIAALLYVYFMELSRAYPELNYDDVSSTFLNTSYPILKDQLEYELAFIVHLRQMVSIQPDDEATNEPAVTVKELEWTETDDRDDGTHYLSSECVMGSFVIWDKFDGTVTLSLNSKRIGKFNDWKIAMMTANDIVRKAVLDSIIIKEEKDNE